MRCSLILLVLVALPTIASAQSCPSIAGAPTGVTLEGIPRYWTTFDCGPALTGYNNVTVSVCGEWQSYPMQQCGEAPAHIVATAAGCDSISFDQVADDWYWGADGQAHVAYTATTSSYYFADVHIGCGTSPLSLKNVTGYQTSQGFKWHFSLESSFMCTPSNSHCGQWNDCGSCTTAPSGNCGWCADTGTCSQGTSTGPKFNESICSSWEWVSGECPAVTTASPMTYAPMTSAPSGSGCSSWTSCYDCTTAPSGNCGWCANSNTCSSGTANGPSTGSCISWDWVQNECPAGAGPKLPEPVGKPHAMRAHRNFRSKP